MAQANIKAWTQNTLLRLRKVLQKILHPFFAAREASLSLAPSVDQNIASESALDNAEVVLDYPESVLDNPEAVSDNLAPQTIELPLQTVQMDPQPVLKTPPAYEPKSLEELFGIDVNGSATPYSSSATTLESLLGAETTVPLWSANTEASRPKTLKYPIPGRPGTDSLSFAELFGTEPESNNSISIPLPPEPATPVPPEPSSQNLAPVMSDPWDDGIVYESASALETESSDAFSPSVSTPETSPMIDLNLDDNNIPLDPQPAPLEMEDTLINRASRGDLEAFRQLLNEQLVSHGVDVFDVESRSSLLQLSLCAEEVPDQALIEPIIKTWVLNVGFVRVQKIELYGHRRGSELPHWRSEFNPSDLEYNIQAQDMGFESNAISPEVSQYLSVLEVGRAGRAEVPVTNMDELWATAVGQDSTQILEETSLDIATVPDGAQIVLPVAEEETGVPLNEEHLTLPVDVQIVSPIAEEEPGIPLMSEEHLTVADGLYGEVSPVSEQESVSSLSPDQQIEDPQPVFNTIEQPHLEPQLNLELTEPVFEQPHLEPQLNLELTEPVFEQPHLEPQLNLELAEPALDGASTAVAVEVEEEPEREVSAQTQRLVKEFLAQYAGGERSFIRIDLSEADLSGINLTLADLQEAQLVWTNLQEASLYHVNLSGAKLRHANLNGAKLRSANLQGADFLNADLSGSDLTWSNLRGANLTGANLTNADLKNAILENVIMPDGTLLD